MDARRRLLLVANPFPPMASGGNTRLVRFCRHLPDYGWEVTVLAPRARGPVTVPEGLEIARVAAPTPDTAYALARRGAAVLHGIGPSWRHGDVRRHRPGPADGEAPPTGRQQRINDWLFLPDASAAWIPPAILAGRRLISGRRFDALMSSYPRPSTHVIGAALASHSGLPWLADYRDPWTTNELRRFATDLHRRAHEAIETRALRRTAYVTAVNAMIADNLARRFPFLEKRVSTITNGFDRTEPADRVELGDGFWFVHTGRLYRRMDEVKAFLQAFSGLPGHVNVLFLGVEGRLIRAEAQRLGISHRVRVEPFASHAYALGCQRAADALLLLTVAKLESLTGKVFEYLAAGRPVFAVTPAGSAAQELLEHAGLAAAAPGDRPLAQPLARFVSAVESHTLPPRDALVVERYDAHALTGALAGILDRMRAPS